MIGVEQWRASIGLYYSGSYRQRLPGKRQLTLVTVYPLLVTTTVVLILVELLVHGVIWNLINGYSLHKGELNHTLAFKNRTSCTQLLVVVCAVRLAAMEAHSGSLERLVMSMAILLIMSEDVEENPGPLSPASSSPESRALRHHSSFMITAIADPLRFSWKLFSTGVIEKATRDEAKLPIYTTEKKNSVLLSAVMCRVETDPSLFHKFLDLLKNNEDDNLKSLGGELEDTYTTFHLLQTSNRKGFSSPGVSACDNNTDEFTKRDTAHTLNPTPAKQRKLLPDNIETQPLYPHSQLLPSHPQLPSYSQSHSQPSHPQCPSQNQLSQHHAHTSQLFTSSLHPCHPCPGLCPHFTQPHPLPLHHHSSPLHCSELKSSSLPPASQSPFKFFVSYLRSFYNSEVPLSYCKWPPVSIKKYINLAVISREEVSSTELKQFMLATLHGNVDQILETKAPILIENILDTNPGEILHCVLVEGAPGVGKTTLSWEICKRWAKRELFQQYTVVLLLRLRDQTVQKAKSFMDLIYYMYSENDEDFRTNIMQHMKQTKGKDTLIILEGLDELPQHLLSADQPSVFSRLLSRKIHILPDATILVTSRPSATVQLRKGWKISRHIEVLGFTEKDIMDYIQSVLSPQKLTAFNNYLSSNPSIRLTMYIPLNCVIVAEVYRCCQQSSYPLPKTTTELYTRLVQTILLRYLENHPDYKDDTTDIDKFTDLPPPVWEHFYKLIEMAYDGVQSQQLIFHDQHNAIEHLGFMNTVTELFPNKRLATYSYNFLHLSLQEYLAAYYVSLKSMDVQQKLLQKMCTEQHLRNTGKFLAGITKYKGMDRAAVKTIIEQQCHKDQSDGSLLLTPYTLQLLHESRDCSIIDGHRSCAGSLTDYSPLLHYAVLGHCIANSSYKWGLTLGGPLQLMQSTKGITMFVEALKSHSNPSYAIERIYCFYDAPECVQQLLLEMPQYALQQTLGLWLYSNKDNPHPLPQWMYELILPKMSKLCSLGLDWGAVSTSGVLAIANIIKNHSTLKNVGLAYNNIGYEGIKALEKIKETKKDLELRITQ